MLGDNNSLDSRYWGLIPYDHIVVKPLFIWLSIFFKKNNYEINYLCKRRRISR
ncbi:S26 family signal peptidase [Candidatus Karelsulcia muelleri]|uniref:S26 family signal peptidase n=1 Tax=Candidatus Karelsulcia muelleri TaxID=336810 RepID=UPI000B92EE6A|nr:S26 family signal peptidase [Candidatus Karelsulcia muelleri]ASS46930.1 signal peptidase I [Candidatus Karelsulcia muelleri]